MEIPLKDIFLQEAQMLEEWCRARSDDPQDFVRREWPDGCIEVVHLASGDCVRKVTPTLHEPWMGRVVVEYGWESCVPREVKEG